MRKSIVAAVAALGVLAAGPATATAAEPIECKVINSVGQKLTGDDLVICFDDPNPRDDLVKYVLSLIELSPSQRTAVAASPNVMCTLERKGLVHSPVRSFCADDPAGL